VGKTTCAAAYAVEAARDGVRTLAVSTDPAHSLGDALAARLSSRTSRVPVGGRRTLDALELDAPRAFKRWLATNRRALADVIEHGTWLDRDDVDALLDLPLPGVDELIGLVEIVRLSDSAYDLVVVDTAPTGHTLRLLEAPRTVGVVAGALDDLQHEHRVIREQLARVWHPEAADRFIERLGIEAAEAGRILRDPSRAAFHWVMLPEAVSLAETRDALGALRSSGFPVPELVLNRVWPDGPPCPICDPRRDVERRVIADARKLETRSARMVNAAAEEPRGVTALGKIGKVLRAPKAPPKANKVPVGRPFQGRRRDGSERAALQLAREPFAQLVRARLIWVGGKGGVGKSTVASSVAIGLARLTPDRRILLLSTDPAPSLHDILGNGPRIRNFHVRELDAAAEFKAKRAALEHAFDEMTSTIGAGVIAGGGDGLKGLLDLAPPGIDELFGLLSVAESLEGDDVVVVDSAPTGHALRLLEMPEAALEWIRLLMRLLLKYRDLVRPGQLAAELVKLSQSIRRLRALFRDHTAAQFIVVTRAAGVPGRETERLFAALRRLNAGVRMVVVNAMTIGPRCPRCEAAADAERPHLAALARAVRRRWRECVIIQTPLAAPPPRGVRVLEAWTRAWIAGPTSTA
jgi:arsenite-transporting ATPase